ncbi:hypothetical protein SO694_00004249 [Aureococcus anophagefferens]|uniref:Ubiquitin thioesterase OTU n=1 Tax=Aureococcus anophagefferens TaxID=44056 RepID=A0ABR1G8N2_AURAN
MPRYKIRDATGKTSVISVGETATFDDLVAQCGAGVLKSGRPPAVLACDAPSTTLAADVVPSGSLITVEAGVGAAAAVAARRAPAPRRRAPPRPRAPPPPQQAAPPKPTPSPRPAVPEAAPPPPPLSRMPAALRASGRRDAAVFEPRRRAPGAAAGPAGGVDLRHVHLHQPAEKAARRRRGEDATRVCAAVVAGDDLSYPDAALEKPRSEYGAWIAKKDTWGGALELSILAARKRPLRTRACSFDDVALVCVDVRTGVDQRYAGPGATRNCYLLFDGVHYDPLAPGAPESPADVTTVAADDGAAAAAVAALAADAKAKRRFTDAVPRCALLVATATATCDETPVWPEQFTLVQRRIPDNETLGPATATTVTYYDWHAKANLIVITPDGAEADVLWDLELDSGHRTTSRPAKSCTPMSMPVGILRPDWLANATSLGRTRVNGRDASSALPKKIGVVGVGTISSATANGVAGDVAATYVTGIFKTILTDAVGAGPGTLGHLVAEQTPGGMNEMVISEQRWTAPYAGLEHSAVAHPSPPLSGAHDASLAPANKRQNS